MQRLRHSICVGQGENIRLTVMASAMERYSQKPPFIWDSGGEWRRPITAFCMDKRRTQK